MKIKEKSNVLKKKDATINKVTAELTDEQLDEISGGAMIVNHNMASINTLTQLEQNQSSLNKSLSKLSTGMKIESSADDSSGYQISERMRVQIRSLDSNENK